MKKITQTIQAAIAFNALSSVESYASNDGLWRAYRDDGDSLNAGVAKRKMSALKNAVRNSGPGRYRVFFGSEVHAYDVHRAPCGTMVYKLVTQEQV